MNNWYKFHPNFNNKIFLAKDVANWIGHSNVSKMVSNIDEDEKEIHQLSTLTNGYSATFLTEDGLYEVLMQSRKPIARQFKKEVKKTLLTISVFTSASCIISSNLLLTSFAISESLSSIPILNNALLGINVNPLGGILKPTSCRFLVFSTVSRISLISFCLYTLNPSSVKKVALVLFIRVIIFSSSSTVFIICPTLSLKYPIQLDTSFDKLVKI